MLGKDKLIYDATTAADGDSVAAFLHATLKLTSTTVGGKEALDVNVANDITVDMDGVYDGGTNTDPDNAGLIVHVRAAAPADADQTKRTTGGAASADAVVAANVHGLDANAFAMGYNGATWDRLLATAGQLQVLPFGNVADDAADAGNPIKVGGRAITGALTAVATGDRVDQLTDLYRRQWVNTAPNVAGSNAAVAVDDTVGGVALFAAPLAGRRRVIVQNLDNKPIYIGFGTVTTLVGTRVAGGATWSDELGPDLALKAIADTGESCDVRVVQLA